MKEIFVYGTFKNGGKWHFLLENEDFIGEDCVEGQMYLDKNGYYPNLFPGEKQICGEVYSVSEEAFKQAAAIELGADYYLATALSLFGRTVLLFLCNNEGAKAEAEEINEFNAAMYFNKWKENLSPNSDSYREYASYGGVV